MREKNFLKNIDSSDTEIETLQTDVMRFLAIIAFCLLVVFIPIAKELPDTTPSNAELIKKTKTLKEKITSLQNEIKNLKSKLLQISKVLNTTQQKEKIEIKTLSQKTNTQQKEIEKLKIALENRSEKEEKIEKKSSIISAVVSDIKSKFKDVQENLTKEQKDKLINEKEGMAILFSDDDTILELLSQESIKIYIYSSSLLFEVKESNSEFEFIKQNRANFGVNTYMIPENGVPKKLLEKFSKIYASLSDKKIYVTLSNEIQSNLELQLQKHKNGKFIIDKNSKVNYE